jgi:hypothetical protein
LLNKEKNIMKRRYINLLFTATVSAALLISSAAISKDINKTIKGLVVEKPVRQQPNATQVPVLTAGDLVGGGPGGGPGGRVKATPAIYIDNGKYSPELSKPGAVTDGKITDTLCVWNKDQCDRRYWRGLCKGPGLRIFPP